MGIKMLLIEIIVLGIVVFIGLYLDKRRRASKPYVRYTLWTIGEIILMVFCLNSIVRATTTEIMCGGCNDIFGLPFGIFGSITGLLFIGIFDYFYFQKSNKYELIIGIIFTLFYTYTLGSSLMEDILYQLSNRI